MILQTMPLVLPIFLTIAKLTNSEDIKIININSPTLPFCLGQTRIVETKHTFYHLIETSHLNVQFTMIKLFYHNIRLAKDSHNITKTPFNNLVRHA